MSKTIIGLSLLMFLFFSCKNEKKNAIILPNNYSFTKDSSEDLLFLDSIIVAEYSRKYNKDETIQIPLYRALQGSDYLIYLSIPYRISFKKMIAHERLLGNIDTLLLLKETPESYYSYYLKDSIYFVSFIKQLDSNAVLSIFAESKSLEIVGKQLNETNLNNRISK